jgi:hypothetical protein
VSVTAADCGGGEAISSRNADEEWQRILKWHRQAAEDRRRRVTLAHEARRDGRSCAGCGRALDDDETRWLLSSWDRPQAPFGRECIPSGLLARAEGREGYDSRPIERCAGCGCPVCYTRRSWRRRRWALCSTCCEYVAGNRRRAERLAEARLMECAVCGERFQPARSDAITCSSACRQRAYRRRRAVL